MDRRGKGRGRGGVRRGGVVRKREMFPLIFEVDTVLRLYVSLRM